MKMEIYMVRQPRICVLGLTCAIFCYCILLYFHFGLFEGIVFFVNTDKPVQINPTSVSKIPKIDKSVFPFLKAMRSVDNGSDPCGGRYVYIHNLPSRFNEDMVKECCTINKWFDICNYSMNNGLGPVVNNDEGVFMANGWYATNQFTLDIIFTYRIKQYECLTNESSLASAIFVPFYAGLDATRYNWGYNISVRDAASTELVEWLQKRDEWNYMNGKDHFLVGGRTTWDFRRSIDEDYDYGNKLLLLPAVRNMSIIFIESSPWNSNEFAVPYPSYFHPSKDVEVFHWQDRMRKMERKWLFCFGGAPRPGIPKSIRSLLIDQCKNSGVAKLLDCGVVAKKCHSPSSIMKMFQSSVFCLQPPGDSFTRRSAFDSILAGCIPVFFHPNSFYAQYTWYLPKNHTTYSVFIPQDDIRKNVSIEKRLSQIDPQKIKMMREEVINLIPKLVYADPRSKLETLKDAFDVSLEAIINKVTRLRQDMIDGRVNDDFTEELRWKLALLKEGE